ncbi:MAG TPA: hypothetical protein VE404_09480 [Verrucomicrobiae bacterium]|nr:hypothetical protein [Verrucomicrobiae bacterium]
MHGWILSVAAAAKDATLAGESECHGTLKSEEPGAKGKSIEITTTTTKRKFDVRASRPAASTASTPSRASGR